jgi:hypothetical protein
VIIKGKENTMSDEKCDCNEGSCECGCGDGCCDGEMHLERRFLTKEEQISELEGYLADLKLEIQAVEEKLVDLKK